MAQVKKTKNHFGIPYIWTQTDRDAQNAIAEQRNQAASKQSQSGPWDSYVQKNPNRDFFGDLLTAGAVNLRQPWSQYTAQANPQLALLDNDQKIFRLTQVRLNELLQASLLRFVPSGISKQGGFLYYTDRLDRCLVYDYVIPHASQRAVKVSPLVDIKEPDFLYDIGSAIADASDEMRSALKNALVYGHKIVAHRNTMVHVDRRRDQGTAGPFIDTVVLNEMMHKYVYEFIKHDGSADGPFSVVAEVGCGNGLLISSCVQNVPSVRRLVAVDPVMAAVHCTYRNVQANRRQFQQNEAVHHFICGFFEKEMLKECDAIFCNPPYLPLIPTLQGKRSAPSSIGGTSLLSEVVEASVEMLSKSGFLFMIYSSLADDEF